jgi:hypothetical protein
MLFLPSGWSFWVGVGVFWYTEGEMDYSEGDLVVMLAVATSMRRLIADESHWCKGANVLNLYWNSLPHSRSSSAYRWSLTGALEYYVSGDTQIARELRSLLEKHTEVGGYRLSLERFNDHKDITHSLVLACLDRTILYMKEIEYRFLVEKF